MATVEIGSQKVFGFSIPAGSDGELIKQTIISVMTALFLLTVFFLFVFPRFADLAQIAGQVNQLQRESDDLTESLSTLDDFSQNVPDRVRESVFLAIPTRFDPGYILLSLRQLAADNRVSLVSYSLAGGEVGEGDASAAGGAITHQVKIQISGDPASLIAFVDSLSKSLPLGTVTDLSLSEVGLALASGSSEASLDMTLSFYHIGLLTVQADSLSGRALTQADLALMEELATYRRLSSFSSDTLPSNVGKDNLFGL